MPSLPWVDAIKARAEKATPGPWRCDQRHVHAAPDDDESCGLGCEIVGPPEPMLRGQFSRGADGQFIAHAREDVPRLLRAVEVLGEAVEKIGGRPCESVTLRDTRDCHERAYPRQCSSCIARRALADVQSLPSAPGATEE